MRAALQSTALIALLAGCQHNPETAVVAQNPRTAPTRTITNFNESLRCMDDLFLARNIKDVYITSAGIPDATGQVAAGTKEMLITAVSAMSAKSNAFRFVDYDPTQIDVQVLSEMVGLRQDFVAPNYYIRGAITQLDSSVLSSTQAASVSLPFADLAASRDQVVSVISVDLNLGKLVTRQILPGMSSSNSIAVVKSGKGADAGGVFGQGMGRTGISFTVALDRAEGATQAVRNLVELSSIELLGKLTRVPYWGCLKLDQTNPSYRVEAREWFDTMSETERTKFASSNLSRMGYFQSGGDLRESVARYQAENNLVPNGRVDFDLYYRLLSAAASGTAASSTPAAAAAMMPPPAMPEPPASATPPSNPPALNLSSNKQQYRVNEPLVLRASVAKDGFLYCYYQDASGTVARIFPNRFQPDAFVRGNAPVEVPPGKKFSIVAEKPRSRENIACISSGDELGVKLPEALKRQDLESLPVSSLNDVIETFRRLGPINNRTLSVEVM